MTCGPGWSQQWFDSAAGDMNGTKLQVDRATGNWHIGHRSMQYTMFPDALVEVADALALKADRAAVANALLSRCTFHISRRGVSTTVRGYRPDHLLTHPDKHAQRVVDAGNPEAHASVVSDALVSIIWAAYVSPRWAELERMARLMVQTPAPRKNRGTDSFRPIPIRHGGLL